MRTACPSQTPASARVSVTVLVRPFDAVASPEISQHRRAPTAPPGSPSIGSRRDIDPTIDAHQLRGATCHGQLARRARCLGRATGPGSGSAQVSLVTTSEVASGCPGRGTWQSGLRGERLLVTRRMPALAWAPCHVARRTLLETQRPTVQSSAPPDALPPSPCPRPPSLGPGFPLMCCRSSFPRA